ncbi:MAG TPA: hypothetical protein VMS37_09585 [Verrucomicrobiae bacterium]|nr:hypothetical protein [Verrucomicrobiae bacterium]
MPAEKGPQIKIDSFTAKAVPDPKNPDAQLVTGFLGASSEADKTRIYWDASLTSYADVATSDILHTQPIPEEQSPLGGSYIWIKRSADVSLGSAGGQTSKGKFFQGPLMAAYGGQFAAAAGTAAATPGIPIHTALVLCNPSPILCTRPEVCHPSPLNPCFSHIIVCHTPVCPILTVECPVASPGCPPVGPGTPVQGGGGVAAQAMPGVNPTLACSFAHGCWFSWNACPTFFGCGPHRTPACPQFEAGAGAAAPQIAGSFAPGCWFSWNACPTLFGGCGPHHTPRCPQFEGGAGAAGPQIAGSFAAGCWFSWNACPTLFGCGPHHTPGCPR